jgi:hypothetical protein
MRARSSSSCSRLTGGDAHAVVARFGDRHVELAERFTAWLDGDLDLPQPVEPSADAPPSWAEAKAHVLARREALDEMERLGSGADVDARRAVLAAALSAHGLEGVEVGYLEATSEATTDAAVTAGDRPPRRIAALPDAGAAAVAAAHADDAARPAASDRLRTAAVRGRRPDARRRREGVRRRCEPDVLPAARQICAITSTTVMTASATPPAVNTPTVRKRNGTCPPARSARSNSRWRCAPTISNPTAREA